MLVNANEVKYRAYQAGIKVSCMSIKIMVHQ